MQHVMMESGRGEYSVEKVRVGYKLEYLLKIQVKEILYRMHRKEL